MELPSPEPGPFTDSCRDRKSQAAQRARTDDLLPLRQEIDRLGGSRHPSRCIPCDAGKTTRRTDGVHVATGQDDDGVASWIRPQELEGTPTVDWEQLAEMPARLG
jgi:hypothetical protein